MDSFGGEFMSGIPHIYDSPRFFDDIEDNSEDTDDFIREDIVDIEYEELCIRIDEHIIEEKNLYKKIRQMELI